jgi:hypothetical protein
LKLIDKTIIAIGVLDVGYVAWIVVRSFSSDTSQFSLLWQSIVAFGLPFPQLQFGAIVFFYASILVCGLALVFRRKKLAWLNYVQFPVRVVLVVPTLYPIFYVLSQLNVELGFLVTILLLSIVELGRVVIVYRWRQYAT